MDKRLNNPRVTGTRRHPIQREKTEISFMVVNETNEVIHRVSPNPLAMSHYATPLRVGDIIATSGAPFIQEQAPIIINDNIVYRPVRLTSTNSPTQRFALRFVNFVTNSTN
jgi:hypothetical protein